MRTVAYKDLEADMPQIHMGSSVEEAAFGVGLGSRPGFRAPNGDS